MEGIDQNQELIRLYLLGDLDEAQRERLELRVLADAEFKESVLAAEDELAEDYVEGALSEVEREKFDEHFLATPQQRRRVMIARALKEFAAEASKAGPAKAAAAATAEPAPPTARRVEGGLRERLRSWWASLVRLPKPVLAAGMAVLLAAVILSGWFAGPRQAQRRRAAFEAELARLNGPEDSRRGAGRPGLPAAESALIPERLLRSGPPEKRPDTPTVVITRDAEFIRLRLGLIDGQYSSYRAVFKKKGDGETEGKGDEELAAVERRAGSTIPERAVVIDAPAQRFEAGHYLIQLFGRADTGQHELIDDYPFQVVRR